MAGPTATAIAGCDFGTDPAAPVNRLSLHHALTESAAEQTCWQRWTGGLCPLRLGDLFQVTYADGLWNREPRRADDIWLLDRLWEHKGDCSDIVSLRIVG